MESKRPERGQLRTTNKTCVLFQDISRRWASKEVEVKNASNCSERQSLLREDDVHGIAIEEKHSSSRPICLKSTLRVGEVERLFSSKIRVKEM